MKNQHLASAHHAEAHSTARIYTKPDLRERLKEEIMAGNQGGAPGEWSAHKAQLLVHQYREAGGGYTFAKRSSAQHGSPGWPVGQPEEAAGAASRQPRQAWTALAPNARSTAHSPAAPRPEQPLGPDAATPHQRPEADE